MLEDVNELGETALHIAVGEGNTEEIQRLLQGKKELNINSMTNYTGDTPLHVAAIRGNLAVCELLLENTKAFTLQQSLTGETPLSLAFRTKHLDVFLYLLFRESAIKDHESRKDLVKSFFIGGQSLLHHAIDFHYSIEFIYELIELGCDVNQERHIDGKTPLELAKEKGAEDIIFLLKEHGAQDKEIEDKGSSDSDLEDLKLMSKSCGSPGISGKFIFSTDQESSLGRELTK
ncbi:ankyrin repeat domain-containing protein [Thiotrichales bacterium 19S11-10]|nr:ankyrin repeat domain-containing protein [Thiotrichales bacterium 19S11-10]